jgi:uncharacterized membrane protein YqjE
MAGLAGDVLRMAQTRLEMLSVDVQRERDAIVLQLKLGMTSVIAAGVAGISAVLWAALSLEPRPRSVALGLLTLLFVIVSVVAMLLARRALRNRGTVFGAVISQLSRDRSTLNGKQAESESKDEIPRDARQGA